MDSSTECWKVAHPLLVIFLLSIFGKVIEGEMSNKMQTATLLHLFYFFSIWTIISIKHMIWKKKTNILLHWPIFFECPVGQTYKVNFLMTLIIIDLYIFEQMLCIPSCETVTWNHTGFTGENAWVLTMISEFGAIFNSLTLSFMP